MTGTTTAPDSFSALFTPWSIGSLKLKHRVVLAPLTRMRAEKESMDPTDLMVEYYKQRASDGGLIITEGTYPLREGGGLPFTPGLFTPEHVGKWKKVTDAVHSKGGKIIVQLYHLGRANEGAMDIEIVSASDVPLPSKEGEVRKPTPRAMTTEEVEQCVEKFAHGAAYAFEAGFDGVEIHGAHGYLIDQFFSESSNKRTDRYGGSVENRARFCLEIIEACAKAIGEDKLGIRLSPYGHFQGTQGGQLDVALHILNHIHDRYPNYGYVHMVESRGDPSKLKDWSSASGHSETHETLDAFRDILKGGKTEFLAAGGYTAESAVETVTKHGGGIVFGRVFISNPDLPERIKNGWPLAKYDRPTFYTHEAEGYTDYPQYSQPVDSSLATGTSGTSSHESKTQIHQPVSVAA